MNSKWIRASVPPLAAVALILTVFLALMDLRLVIAAPGVPPSGSEFLISRGVHEMQRYSAADYNAARGEFFAVWTDEGGVTTYATYGQRLAADGTLTGSQAISVANSVPVNGIAYNSISDTHLAVWYGGSPYCISGQIISGSGALVGAPITISTLPGNQYIPAVAYNSTNNLWLVAWFSGTSDSDVYAQLVRADGMLQGGAIGLTVGAPGNQRDVAIAYNSAANEFLVVWQDGRNGNNDIYGRRLAGATGNLLGSEIQVVTQAANQWMPSVAYNLTGNEYLIVWADWNSYDVRAQRVAADGSLPTPDFLVSTHLGTGSNTSVVYNLTNQEYLVVWQDERGGGNADDIYAQRVSGAGALIGSDIAVAAASGWQQYPHLACHATSGQCLVTWGDPRTGGNDYDVYARLFNADGAPAANEFIVSVAPHNESYPAVAVNTSDGSALAVWSGNPAGGSSYNAYGQVIRSSGALSGANIALSSSGSHKTSPAVAYNGADRNYLAVWANSQSGVDIYGHIISASGALSGTDDVFIASASDIGGSPSIAYNSTNNEYLVAYVDAFETFPFAFYYRIGVARVSRNGAVITRTSLSDYTDAVQEYPDVAYGSGRNLYVTVWHSGTLIYGQVVSANGALSGTIFPISPTTVYQSYPAIAYNSANDEFLSVWMQLTGPSTSTLYARRLTGAGAPTGTPFTITGSATWADSPDVAYDSNRNEYLVAWPDTRTTIAYYDLRAQRLAANGTLVGDVILLSSARHGQTNVAQSYNPVQREYLAVWQDDRNCGADALCGDDDVYGVRIPARPDLSLSSKSVTSGTARPGDALSYTITIVNSGLISATATLSDRIPANTTYVPASAWASAGTLNDTAGIRWNGIVTSGESVTVTFAARLNVPLANNTTIVNRAYITDTINTETVTRAVTTTVQSPIFTLVKSDAPDPVEPGAILTYTIWLTNAGYAEASGVVVTETYDSSFIFLGANPAPSVSNNVWTIGALGVGMGRAIVVTGKVNSGIANGTVLTNVATLDSDQTAPQQTTVTTVASNNPLLTLAKSAPFTVGPGQLLVYTIRIANSGLRDATGVVLTDTLPFNITDGSATPAPSAGVIAAGNTITWSRGTLGIGQSDAITLVVNVETSLPDGTVLTNTARVTCNEGATAFGRTTTTVYKPMLSVTKMDTPDPVVPGGALTYTILISSASGGEVLGVAIQETYGSWFVYQSAVPAPASGNSYWYTDTLASGQAYTIVVTGRVTHTAQSGGMLLNTVTVYWDFFSDSTSTTIVTNVSYRVLLPIILKGS